MRGKYELGDRLWPVGRNPTTGRPTLSRPFDCMFMWLDGNEIVYSFTKEYGFYEINVFATEEAAKTECDRRDRELLAALRDDREAIYSRDDD